MSAGDCLNRTQSYNLEVCMLQKAKNLLIVVLVAIAVVIEIPLAIIGIVLFVVVMVTLCLLGAIFQPPWGHRCY